MVGAGKGTPAGHAQPIKPASEAHGRAKLHSLHPQLYHKPSASHRAPLPGPTLDKQVSVDQSEQRPVISS